jgi:hypothetical protein
MGSEEALQPTAISRAFQSLQKQSTPGSFMQLLSLVPGMKILGDIKISTHIQESLQRDTYPMQITSARLVDLRSKTQIFCNASVGLDQSGTITVTRSRGENLISTNLNFLPDGKLRDIFLNIRHIDSSTSSSPIAYLEILPDGAIKFKEGKLVEHQGPVDFQKIISTSMNMDTLDQDINPGDFLASIVK